MKRILFVDDDMNVLKGLQRMLHSMRGEWEMKFAESGREALEIMAAEPFDMVVSDMRMPEMDGAELLATVRKLYPRTVRMILSGHSDRQMIVRAAPATHQFLTKPCEAAMLKETIRRSCALHELLSSDGLVKMFFQLDTLPCLHEVYIQLVEQLCDPDVSMEKIGKTISQDVAMSAKILQLANTPFFGICQHVSSPAQAATLLGVDTIKALTLTAGIFSDDMDATMGRAMRHELQTHSLMVGALAKQIASECCNDSIAVDHAFTGGILHDLGKLIIAANLPQIGGETANLAQQAKLPIWRIEKEWLGADHAEIGACLMALWGMPDPIVEAIAFHHRPSRHPGRSITPLTAVHVADALSREADEAFAEEGGLDLEYIEALGLTGRIARWRGLCTEQSEEEQAGRYESLSPDPESRLRP